MTKSTLWLAIGVALLVFIACVDVFTIVFPVYVMGRITAYGGSSFLASLMVGLRKYVAALVAEDHQLTVASVCYRFAFRSVEALALLVVASGLAFRKRWAWYCLWIVLLASALNFTALLAWLIVRNPQNLSWRWLLGSFSLDAVLLYGSVVFVFLMPSVRALYLHREQA